jgi:hypothetical protein
VDKKEISEILQGYYKSIMDKYEVAETDIETAELFGMLKGYRSALILLEA